jgi:hypothetical protein
MSSPNCSYLVTDIFKLQDCFKENEFEVCTSIETFEHLPPDRIDDYLQSLRYCTSETIIITTPKRKTPVWNYDGGTHLYEYDQNEMYDILTKNFKDDEVTAMGLVEYQLPNGQWGTDITTDLSQAWVFFCIINLKK